MKKSSRLRLPVGIAALIAIAWLVWATVVPVGGTRRVVARIPKGATAGRIGEILAEKGLIRSAFGFKLMARISRKGGDLKPGAYALSGSMSAMQIIDKIASGDACSRWVTIPEGYSVVQIADALEASGLCKSGRFSGLALRAGRAFPTSFPHPVDSLEGYLFPDTYLSPIGASENALIREMLDCFRRKVAEPLADDFVRSDMSFAQIITLASLIEREARVPKDRPLISAVLRNRLRKNMRLQCDATVIYALGHHVDRVLYRDLRIDSPYNTYRYAGLPPGPIASPGLDSIKAALHPANVSYLYYVAKADGSHIFSDTLEEHDRAIAEARAEGGR